MVLRHTRRTRPALQGILPLDRLLCLGDRAMGAFSFLPAMETTENTDTKTLLELAEQARKLESIANPSEKTLREFVLLGGSPQGALLMTANFPASKAPRKIRQSPLCRGGCESPSLNSTPLRTLSGISPLAVRFPKETHCTSHTPSARPF